MHCPQAAKYVANRIYELANHYTAKYVANRIYGLAKLYIRNRRLLPQ